MECICNLKERIRRQGYRRIRINTYRAILSRQKLARYSEPAVLINDFNKITYIISMYMYNVIKIIH